MENINNDFPLTHDQARTLLITAMTEPGNKTLPYNAIECLDCFDDELTVAAIDWLKRQNDRRWVIDTRFFVPVMNKSPMTSILFEAYQYILSSYDFDSIPRSFYDPTTITQKAVDISKALTAFKLYNLAGFHGETPWQKTSSVFCCIYGDKTSTLAVSEEEASCWLRDQMEAAYASGYRVFVTCGDIGVGCLAGECVLEMKKNHPECRLLIVAPAISYEVTEETENYYQASLEIRKYLKVPDKVREDMSWKPRIEAITKSADMKYFVEFPLWNTPAHFKARDKWVVEHCNRIIALYSDHEIEDKELMAGISERILYG